MDQQVKEQIENSINNSDVCLFMKGSPEAPQCGFSMAVKDILKILEVKYQRC
jgi:Glutaredoxin-related protein